MHDTTFRVIKVTSQVATPGVESAVYDCLVHIMQSCAVYLDLSSMSRCKFYGVAFALDLELFILFTK